MNILKKIKNYFKRKYLNNNDNVISDKFTRNNDLIIKKLIEYIPAMLITNLSSFLLVSVDSIVCGHFIGENALSSIQYILSCVISIKYICRISLYRHIDFYIICNG